MDCPDLSGVHPLRLDQTRRRIATITSFLEIDDPTPDQRLEHAGRLGLGVSQFLALARSWRENRDATRLHGAGTARGRSRATGPRHLPDEAKKLAREALRDMPADATLATAHGLVEARLRQAGLPVPSKATVWRFMTERSRTVPQDQKGDVAVTRVRLRLPVDTGDGLVFPTVTVAVVLADGRIIAARPSDGASDVGIIAAAAATAAARHGRAHVDDRLAIDDRLASIMPTQPSKARVLLVRAVGKAIGNIELKFNSRSGDRPERLLKARGDEAVPSSDLQRVLDEAVSIHNASRPGGDLC